jgi:glutamate formiminotransferase/glutamate formiminotransferase/formiminotetrahydrofolate cyclodeaminase
MTTAAGPLRLLAVPNISEGRDPVAVAAIAAAFGPAVLDVHSDPDHHRTVITVAGGPGELRRRVLAGAREALRRVDLRRHHGVHPRVGALDVAPIVHLDSPTRGAACAEALTLADDLASEFGLPVFLYGILTRNARSRADLRRGGLERLAAAMERRELVPDFGPPRLHPTAGAVLVAARPPLVAFNLELAPPATADDARRIAALVREGGEEGLPCVRAIGLHLEHRGRAQVSFNVEDHVRTPLSAVV